MTCSRGPQAELRTLQLHGAPTKNISNNILSEAVPDIQIILAQKDADVE